MQSRKLLPSAPYWFNRSWKICIQPSFWSCVSICGPTYHKICNILTLSPSFTMYWSWWFLPTGWYDVIVLDLAREECSLHIDVLVAAQKCLHYPKGYLSSHAPLQFRSKKAQKAGDRTKTAGPSWRKEYPIPYGVTVNNRIQGVG